MNQFNETTKDLINEAAETMARMPFIDQNFVLRDTIIRSIIQEVCQLAFSEGYRIGFATRNAEVQNNPVLTAAPELLKFAYEVKSHSEANFTDIDKARALEYLAAMASNLINRTGASRP